MKRRCRFSVPKTTWAYVLILAVIVVGAVMREINLLIILAGLMSGPLLISWQLIRTTLDRLSVHRRTPVGVFPETPFVVEVEVSNTRRRLDSWALRIEDRFRRSTSGPAMPHAQARCLIPHLPAGQQRSVSYRATLPTRGRYRLGPLRISTQVPVGLLKGQVTFDQTNDILVYPRLGQLQSNWTQMVRFDKPGPRSFQRRQGPVEGDFFGLREWRAGDSRRWIHWRSSAKRNQLVVRQFEQHRNQDQVILLDLGRSAVRGTDDQAAWDTIEKAISFTATVIAAQCRRGTGGITLAVAGSQTRLLRGSASSALLTDALELLADAAPTARDPLPELIRETLAATTGQDRLLIVALQPIDPHDLRRFPYAAPESIASTRLAKALCVDASTPQFDNLFGWDERPRSLTTRMAP
jgi:uncharacterized protein (DUF58 family)